MILNRFLTQFEHALTSVSIFFGNPSWWHSSLKWPPCGGGTRRSLPLNCWRPTLSLGRETFNMTLKRRRETWHLVVRASWNPASNADDLVSQSAGGSSLASWSPYSFGAWWLCYRCYLLLIWVLRTIYTAFRLDWRQKNLSLLKIIYGNQFFSFFPWLSFATSKECPPDYKF